MNGAHDSTFGCKFQSNHCIKSLTSYDIYILTETCGCSHEFDIPQFEMKVILPSKLKGRKSGRSSDGIIILYKSHLKSKIEFTKICPFYLWFKLKNFSSSNILTGNTKYLHICAVYIPPESSPYFKDDILYYISNDINNFENLQTPIMLCGDFSSITGKLLDYVPDKGDEHLKNNLKVTTQIVSNRKTSDSEINNHRKKLINLCKENNLRIINGRCLGDSFGQCTFSRQGAKA